MTPEQVALARRLVAHPRWEGGDVRLDWTDVGDAFLPDLTDPATVGVLLAMLPAERIRSIRPYHGDGGTVFGWRVEVYAVPPSGAGTMPTYIEDTLGEACAHALLTVWGEP